MTPISILFILILVFSIAAVAVVFYYNILLFRFQYWKLFQQAINDVFPFTLFFRSQIAFSNNGAVFIDEKSFRHRGDAVQLRAVEVGGGQQVQIIRVGFADDLFCLCNLRLANGTIAVFGIEGNSDDLYPSAFHFFAERCV